MTARTRIVSGRFGQKLVSYVVVAFAAVGLGLAAPAHAGTGGGSIPIGVTVPWSGTLVCTDAGGFVLSNDPTVAPGQTIRCILTGFTAGESVQVVLVPGTGTRSSAQADGTGIVSYSFVAPTDLGPHTLTFIGQQSQGVVSFAFVVGVVGGPTVTPSPTPSSPVGAVGGGSHSTSGGGLAATGADIEGLLAIGAALLGVGALLSIAHRLGVRYRLSVGHRRRISRGRTAR